MKHMRAAMGRIWKDAVTYRGFILAFLVYDIAVLLLFHNFCPSVFITGLPCPGCGTTRAIFYFLTGQFEKGWAMHPLGICWLALIFYFCLMRYVLGKRPAGVLQAGAVLAVCMAAVYGWRMLFAFPGEAPMVYVPGNLLEKIIPDYLKIIEEISRIG